MTHSVAVLIIESQTDGQRCRTGRDRMGVSEKGDPKIEYNTDQDDGDDQHGNEGQYQSGFNRRRCQSAVNSKLCYIPVLSMVFFILAAPILIPEGIWMFKRLFLTALILLACSIPVLAIFPGSSAVPDLTGTAAAAEYQFYGEILDISPTAVYLDTGDGVRRLQLADRAQIYCNGMPAAWRALRPIYQNAYFEAYVYLNEQKEVCAIRGFYNGQECLVEDWTTQEGELRLTLRTVEGEEQLVGRVAPGARLPRQINWLETGETVFVLFNAMGGVRGVYLIQ